MQLIKFYTNQK